VVHIVLIIPTPKLTGQKWQKQEKTMGYETDHKWNGSAAISGTGEAPCSPSPYELACRMLNAIGWNGNDFRLRDQVALAIAPEVDRINRRANASSTGQEARP
jgi:hypothetical protein